MMQREEEDDDDHDDEDEERYAFATTNDTGTIQFLNFRRSRG